MSHLTRDTPRNQGGFKPQNSTQSSIPSKSKVPIQYSAIEMKRKLTAQLEKEKCEIYLKILGQMLTGDLSKSDFDKQVKVLLSEEQRKLHNLFVITILRSAYGSIATSNTQRRSVKVTPLVPRLGARSREITKQPIWSKINARMQGCAKSHGLTVDIESVNAVMMGLEHHLKSILSLSQPTSRLAQRIMVSPIRQQIAQLENREVVDRTKKGDITANNIKVALSIVPNCFSKRGISWEDDFNFYHVHNNFARVHQINAVLSKQETVV